MFTILLLLTAVLGVVEETYGETAVALPASVLAYAEATDWDARRRMINTNRMKPKKLKKAIKKTWRKGMKLEKKIAKIAKGCGESPGSREWMQSHMDMMKHMSKGQLQLVLEFMDSVRLKAVAKYKRLKSECKKE